MLLHLITRVQSTLYTFHRDERGLTVVEYAVAGGLISLIVIVAFEALGVTVGGIIQGINDELAP